MPLNERKAAKPQVDMEETSIGDVKSRDQMGHQDNVVDQLTYARYNQFVKRAVAVFGDEYVANQWLNAKQEKLGNLSPLETAQSKNFDTEEFEALFGRLEHGLFS